MTTSSSLSPAALNEKDAAKYIGMSVYFLQRKRMKKGKLSGQTPGPKWIKIGNRIRYLKCELDHWLQKHVA